MCRKGFTLIELLVVLAIIAVLVALLLPAVQFARAAARNAKCQSNLKQLGIALKSYHDSHNVLPPAKINPGSYAPVPRNFQMPVLGGGTKNTTGWVLVLPYLEQSQLYENYNADLCSSANAVASGSLMPVAGSDAANSTTVGAIVSIFLCPADQTPRPRTYRPNTPTDAHSMNNAVPGSYLFATGTFSDSSKMYKLTNNDKGQGAFGNNGAARVDQIEDGASNTILVGEELHSGGQSNTGPWWGAGVSGCCHGSTTPDSLGRFSSAHSSILHFLFGDSSVRSITTSVDKSVFFALNTIQGGEAVKETF